jgi:hypothetical protein
MHTSTDSFTSIDPSHLDSITGGFDVNRMVDNGNRWGTAGALTVGGAGAAVGGVVGGVAGAAAGGVGAIPGAIGGAAAGGGIGAAAGGFGGFVGGAAADAYQQLRGR